MNLNSILWDSQHRKETWDLIKDAGEILKIPLSPTIITAINYIHRYFEISGKLDLPLYHIALLATFVASKTQETFCKVDDLINAFAYAGLNRSDQQLSVLGTNKEILNGIKDQDTEFFEDFRKMFLDSELDFMTALKWNFPNHLPFRILKKWLDELRRSLTTEYFNSIFNQLTSKSIEALCNLVLYPDSLHTKVEDIAACSISYGWNQFNFDTDWSTIIEYDTSNESYISLLNRLGDNTSSDEK